MVAAGGDVEDGVEGGRLPRRGEHGRTAPLQLADLGGHVVIGGILQAGVEIPALLQVKQGAHLLAGGVAEGGALNNGDIPGLPVTGGITPVDTFGALSLLAHGWSLPFLPIYRCAIAYT